MNWTNGLGADVVSGQAVLVGAVLGVATNDIPDGADGVLATEGVFTLPAVDGVETDWTQGTPLYWDAGNAEVTDDDNSNANTPIGVAWAAKLEADTTALVKINSNAYLAEAGGGGGG